MKIIRWFRIYRAVVLLLILAAFILRIHILKVRFFDPDEFQHLHGARQIYHGQMPYRDYFEHHTPFLHFILTGFYSVFGEEISILFAARVLMLIFTAAIIYLTYVLAKNLYSSDTGLFAALFLSYVIMFLEKTIEVRPDVPAMAFWLASLIFMIKGARNDTSSVKTTGSQPVLLYSLSGLMMGIAIMFTQKSLFALGGIFIALIWMFIDPRMASGTRSLKLTALFLGSMMVPIVPTLIFFYAKAGLWQFINCNFIMNFRWKVKFWPFDYIKRMLSQNPFFSVISILGLFIATFRFRKREEIKNGNFIPVLCTHALITGLFVMPVPYRQYYLLFLPILAVYCAFVLSEMIKLDIRRLISDVINRRTRVISVVLIIFMLVLMTAGLASTLHLSKPHIFNSRILYILMWVFLFISAVFAFTFKRNAYAVLALSIGIIAYPLEQTVDQLSNRNDKQLASVQYIMDITSPEDTVLDGWSGFGFLRPHAYYYYFLHPEMRAMLSEQELSDDLIENLEEKATKVVIYDSSIKSLPKKVQRYIAANYVPTKHGNIYVRKFPLI